MTAAPSQRAFKEDVLLFFIPYDIPEQWIQEVTARHPGLQVRWVNSRNGDGSMKAATDLAQSTWDGVTIICTYMPPPYELVSSVRFVQLQSAGADKWSGHELYAKPEVPFCTASGIHAPQIAEWVIGAWLSHQHYFPQYLENMKRGAWENPYGSAVHDSGGQRMQVTAKSHQLFEKRPVSLTQPRGILGYGAIGRQVARLARALGMEVLAYTRGERLTSESRADSSYCVPGTGDPEGLIPSKWFSGPSKESINNFLSQSLDILVICLPLTPETRGLLSDAQFGILSKNKTFVANVGRGGHIDQNALLRALENKQIRGAALDVTDPEPLPADHPLWKAPNLFITPHVSWKSEGLWDRLLDLAATNLDNLAAGRLLVNMVNRALHY